MAFKSNRKFAYSAKTTKFLGEALAAAAAEEEQQSTQTLR